MLTHLGNGPQLGARNRQLEDRVRALEAAQAGQAAPRERASTGTTELRLKVGHVLSQVRALHTRVGLARCNQLS